MKLDFEELYNNLVERSNNDNYLIGEARAIISVLLSEPKGIPKEAIHQQAKEWLTKTSSENKGDS